MSNESEPRFISQHIAYRGEAKEAARIHPLAECHRFNGLGDRLERLVRGHPLLPGAAGLLLRQPVPQLPLYQLAQLSNMAAPSSRGGQGGRRLTKGAGRRAESPGAA
jgi:hypothetical protein